MNNTHILSGAVSGKGMLLLHWDVLEPVLKTKESQKDFESLRLAAHDLACSTILTGIAENQCDTVCSACSEEEKLQQIQLWEYLNSCDFIKHDSCATHLIRSGLVDIGNFDLLFKNLNGERIVSGYIWDLKRLNYVHQFYAFRKALAKYEFDQWDKILSKARSSDWPLLYNRDLEKGYQENRSLFLYLKKHTSISADHKTSKSLSTLLIEAIDREYATELCKKYHSMAGNDQAWFKALLRNRALEIRSTEFQAKKINYLPKDYERTLVLKSVPWLFKAGMLEKASLVRDRVGEKCVSGLTNRWAKLVGAGVVVAAFTMPGLKKAQRS